MRSALKTCVSLALCQPANADLNLAAGDVFLFKYIYIYIYSLQDKLLISPKIVCCDMIPNLGGPNENVLTSLFWSHQLPLTQIMTHATITTFLMITGEAHSITGINMDICLETMTLVLNGMVGIDSSLMDRVLRCPSGVSVTCHVEVLVLCGLVALILSQKMELLLVKSTALLMISAVPTHPTLSKSKLVLEITMSTSLKVQSHRSQCLYIVQVQSFSFMTCRIIVTFHMKNLQNF